MKVHQSAESHPVLKELSGFTQHCNSFSIDHKVRDLIAALTLAALRLLSDHLASTSHAACSLLTGTLCSESLLDEKTHVFRCSTKHMISEGHDRHLRIISALQSD